MPSARNVTTTTLIVAAIGLSATNVAVLNGLRNTAATPEDYQGLAVMTEDLVFLTGDNATPAIRLDQQDALSFQADADVEFGSGDLNFNSTRNPQPLLMDGDVTFHGTDRVTMAAPTGNTNQYIAAAVNPFTGTGIVVGRATTILCDGTPNSMAGDVSIMTSATASGTVLASDDNRAIASGSIMTFSGLYLVPKDQYFGIVSASGSDVTRGAPDCDLIPYWVEV